MKNLIGLLLLVSAKAFAGANETCEPTIIYKDRIIEKVVYKTIVDVDVVELQVPVEKKVNVTRKNRLSLIGAHGPKGNLDYNLGAPIVVRTNSEVLGGLQYTRDLGRTTLGILGLTNETVGFSIGINY